MRPTPLRRRGLPALVAVLLTAGAILGAGVSPAAAANPGPSQLPVLSGLVRDACTGLPVAGLSVGVTSTINPGPIQAPSAGPVGGAFSYGAISPGPVQLTVSAPGYVALGGGPGPAAGSPGVTVTANPGPVQLPAGQSVSVGLVLDIRLVPTFPPSPCRDPGPTQFPAVAGRVVNAATGQGLRGLTVGLAPLVADPTTGQVNPGPVQLPSFGPLAGFFVYKDPGPIQFGFRLYAAAPGHVSLGQVNPGPAQAPGVTVTVNPGPCQLPAGTGAVTGSVLLSVGLPAASAGG